MMDDILVIAQLDSSNDVLPLEPIHIGLLCHHEMDQLKKLQQKPNIDYRIEGDKHNDLIYSDPSHFSIIISHLLNNANKFTEQGSITLSYQLKMTERRCVSVLRTPDAESLSTKANGYSSVSPRTTTSSPVQASALSLPPDHPTPQRQPPPGYPLHRRRPLHITVADKSLQITRGSQFDKMSLQD